MRNAMQRKCGVAGIGLWHVGAAIGVCALIASVALGFLWQAPLLEPRPGSRVDRAISGPEPHIYNLAVPAGKFFQVVLDNRSGQAINPLWITLQTSDGTRLALSEKRISWIGERGAAYQIKVQRQTLDYLTSDPRASYALQIVEFRDARSTDSNILAGEKAMREERYSDAVTEFRIAGDPAGLTDSLASFALTQSGQARLNALFEALKIAGDLGDRAREANDLLQLAWHYGSGGDFQTSLNYAYRSLSAAQEAGSARDEGRALGQIGGLYQDLGDSLTALDMFTRSLEASNKTKAPQVTMNALNGIAAAHTALGDATRSLEYKRRTVDFAHDIGNRNIEALQRNTLAAAYLTAGQYDLAMDQLNHAMELYRNDHHPAGQMRTFISMGNVYLARRDPARAQAAFRNALQIESGYKGPDGPEHSGPMRIGMGEALLLTGNRQGALDYFKQALAVFRQLHDWRGEAEALRRLAEVETRAGNLLDARRDIEDAITIVESVRGRLNGPAFRATYSASKRVFYESYIDLLSDTGADVATLEASERFRMRSLVEMLNEAGVDIRQGVDAALVE